MGCGEPRAHSQDLLRDAPPRVAHERAAVQRRGVAVPTRDVGRDHIRLRVQSSAAHLPRVVRAWSTALLLETPTLALTKRGVQV